MKELSNRDKVILLKEILSEWERKGSEQYICLTIMHKVHWKGWISEEEWVMVDDSTTFACTLLPELLDFKPQEAASFEFKGFGWFGPLSRYGDTRTRVLRKIMSEYL